MSKNNACLLEEYVNGDKDLAVCRDVNDSSWEGTFYVTLGQEQGTKESESEGDEPENAVDDEQPVKIKSYKEANKLLEEVQHFLESKGHLKGSNYYRVHSRQCVEYSVSSNQSNYP